MRRKSRCPYCRTKNVDKGAAWFERLCRQCGVGWETGGGTQTRTAGTIRWTDVPRGCMLVLETASWEEDFE